MYIRATQAIQHHELGYMANWKRTITQESEVFPMKERVMSLKSWTVNQGLARFDRELPVVDISEIRGDLIIGIIRAFLLALTPLLALYLSKREILSKGFDRILTIIDKETE